jgi:hypothetical protein
MLTKFDVEKYFVTEKQESLFFLAIGIIALLLGVIFLLFIKSNFYRGAALPLIVIALLQITVGYTIYKRSDEDRIRVVYAMDMNPSEVANKELPRMKIVNTKFIVYRFAEIALAILGIILMIYFRKNAVCTNSFGGNAFWVGLGIALTIQSLLMLGADFFAEQRGKIYATKLEQFVNKK